jgi:soluble lytic murein transglycosylase-like protein
MRCTYFGSRIVMPLGAILSVLVLQALASGPALASVHSRARHSVAYRHHVRHHHRFLEADTVAPGIYGYAPASLQNDNWNESRWHENHSNASHWNESRWNENGSRENNWAPSPRRWHDTEHSSFGESSPVDSMAASAASAAGIPAALVERVIKRESGGNPRAVSRGNYGLMQIRLGTAHAMGYSGDAAGLLDAQTNMTYAVRYLAGAYRAAGGNENRAIALYARGYYGQAKAQGFSPYGSGEGPDFAAYQPERTEHFAETSYEPFGEAMQAPIYHVRHHRRRTV